MTPILYESSEAQFITKGIGSLSDAISCVVTEERNGIFELGMEYPADGVLYGELQDDRIILAKPNETMQTQPFRIYNISIPIDGKVSVFAEHISYQLNDIPVFPFAAGSCPEAVAGMVANSVTPNPFTFSTDKTTVGNFVVSVPSIFRSLLYGVQGSIVDVYGGGDYCYDRWTVQLLARRGQDNGVVVEYGKNLTDLKQENSIASLISGVAPYWTDGEGGLVTLPEKVIIIQNNYAFDRVSTLDLSQEFEEAPTEDQLRAAANNYIQTTDLTTPKVSLTVSFVPLWQTEDYKENPLYSQIAGLERVSMGDTVRVKFVKYGIDASARVIKTVYDVLMERYNSVSIGDPSSTSVSRTVENQLAINEAPTTSMMEQAILNATNAITGATGGYVVLDPPKNPQRILIMDTPDKATAVNVWQWNLNGLGYSSSGIDGPYTTAITVNPGAIVADFITAGTLNANIIKAGVIQDAAGKNSINMVTGDVSMQGTFIATGTAANGQRYTLRLNGTSLSVYNSSGAEIGFFGVESVLGSTVFGSKTDRVYTGALWLTSGDGSYSQVATINSSNIVSLSASSGSFGSLSTGTLNSKSITWVPLTINGTTYQLLAGS